MLRIAKRNRGLAVIIAAAVTTTSFTAASPSEADPANGDPVALAGTVHGLSNVKQSDVFAFVKPKKSLEASYPDGTSVAFVRLPDTDIRVTGNRYKLVVDPRDLPANTIGDSGLVTFQVLVQDPGSATFGETTASVREVTTKAGDQIWLDPLSPVPGKVASGSAGNQAYEPGRAGSSSASERAPEQPGQAPPAVADVTPTIDGILCDARGCRGKSSKARHIRLDAAARSDGTKMRMAAAQQSATASGCWNVYGDSKIVKARIGSSFPVGNDTSWMTFTRGSSAQYKATFGVASNAYTAASVVYEQSSTEGLDRSFGFEWDKKGYKRAYNVNVKYRKLNHYYDRCPPAKPFYSDWVPVSYPGGVGEKKSVTRPNWTHCQAIWSTGKWWRSTAGYNSFTNNKGVNLAGVIGINLSSTRAYNAEAKLAYHIGVPGRRLCSPHTDPAHAGNIMERIKK